MYNISKEFNVEYAHRLNLPYESACRNIHGHSGRIVISITSDALDENYMIIDFVKLKEDIQKKIQGFMDHVLILNKNDVFINILSSKTKVLSIDGEPTAENLSKMICNSYVDPYLQKINLRAHEISVTFYETVKNSATFTKTLIQPIRFK